MAASGLHYFVFYGNNNEKINRCQDVRCIRDPAEQGHPTGRHHLRAPLRDLLHGQRGARRQEPVPQALRRGRGRRGEQQMTEQKYLMVEKIFVCSTSTTPR